MYGVYSLSELCVLKQGKGKESSQLHVHVIKAAQDLNPQSPACRAVALTATSHQGSSVVWGERNATICLLTITCI